MAFDIRDTNDPPYTSMEYYSLISEPKGLGIVKGDHHKILGKNVDVVLGRHIASLVKTPLQAQATAMIISISTQVLARAATARISNSIEVQLLPFALPRLPQH